MRLRDLEIIITAPPAPGWGGRYWIFVKLATESGVTGVGECYASAIGPDAMRAVIQDVFSRHMEGEEAENLELMFRRVYSSGFTQRPDPTVMGAFSGLEIACWDILGKAHDRPVWALTGGRMNARLRAYSYLYPLPHHDADAFWNDSEKAVESAASLVEQGYTAVKFDPAGPYTIHAGHQPSRSDIERARIFCAALRKAFGSRIDLLLGTHGQFSTSGAIRLGSALAPCDPLWFEEPVPPDNLSAFGEVVRAQPVPVAAGERMTCKAEFAALLREGVRILQPDLGRAGGLSEARKIAALAEVHNAQIAPHLYSGPVLWAANVQLATTLPNFLLLETIDSPFHRALIGDSIEIEEGHVIPPGTPGLGIDFNEACARAHPYDGTGLHLEMQEAPCDYTKENRFPGGAPVRRA